MASWCNDPEFPSDERVTRTRDALAKAKTESQAMIALSDADTATLREIEAEYFFHPGSAEDLRERIVAAHLQYISMMGAQALHTKLVTSDVVAGWAAGVLSEWLPGYTDFRAEWGGQYRIRQLL